MIKVVIVIILTTFYSFDLNSQSFLNGGLEGICTKASQLPINWDAVPYSDPSCSGTEPAHATPDLTSWDCPAVANGIVGNPYNGSSFISGLCLGPNSNHEGIMQNVEGFKVDNIYSIRFYQTVSKQLLPQQFDTSGSWAVYLDNELIGISIPSVSYLPAGSTSLVWDLRSIQFKAKASKYLIKFMPTDDDDNYNHSELNGGLRMAIDDISIMDCGLVDLGRDTALCPQEFIVLDGSMENASYKWQDNSNDPKFYVNTPGLYWVSITTPCATLIDSINVTLSNECDCKIYLPNVFTPNLDNINDYFGPNINCNIKFYALSVFDRWGSNVFSSQNPLEVWDGMSKGKMCQEGVYLYSLRYSYSNKSIMTRQGTLTLIK